MALFDNRERIQAPPDMVWQAVSEFARKGKIEIEQPYTFLIATQLGFAFAYLLEQLPDGSTDLWHVIDRADEFQQAWHADPNPQAALNALVNAPTSAFEDTLKSTRSMLAGLLDVKFDSSMLLQGTDRVKKIKKTAENSARQSGWSTMPVSSEFAAPANEPPVRVPLTPVNSLESEQPSAKRRIHWKRILPALIAVIVLAIFALARLGPAITGELAVSHFNKGVELGEQGEWDAAIDEYTQALQLDNKMAMAYVNRGHAYFQRSKWNPALADFDQAIALDPQLAMAYHNRGLIYGLKGETGKALADAHSAIQLDPQAATSYWLCGMLHLDQEEKADAKSDLEQALKLGLDPGMQQSAEEALAQLQ